MGRNVTKIHGGCCGKNSVVVHRKNSNPLKLRIRTLLMRQIVGGSCRGKSRQLLKRGMPLDVGNKGSRKIIKFLLNFLTTYSQFTGP